MVERRRFQADSQFRPAPAADETVAPTAMAQLFTAINNDVSQRLDQATAIAASKAGAEAGAGKINTQLQKGNTIAALNFNDAAKQAMASELKTRLATEAEDILREHPTDIEGAGEKFKSIQSAISKEVTPDLQPFAIEEFNSVSARVKGKILDNAFTQSRNEQNADIELGISRSISQMKEAALENDRGRVLQLQQEADEQILSLSAHGFLTPGEAGLRIEELERDVETELKFGEFMGARARGRGQQFFDEFNKKPPKNIDKKQFESLRSSMRTQLNTDKVDTELTKTKLRSKVSDAVFVMQRGVIPDDLDSLITQSAGFPDLQEKLLINKRNAQIMGGVADLNLVQQRNVINELAATEPNTREDIELLESLEAINKDTERLLKEDPASLMAKNGEEVAPLNVEDEQSLLQRRELGEKIQIKYGVEAHGLTKAEVSQVEEVIDVATPAEQIGLFQNFQATLGDDQTAVLMQDIAPTHPEFVVAAGVSNEVPSVARDILIGQELLKTNPNSSPNNADVALIVDETLGNVFPPETRGQITKSAIALDAANRFRKGTTSKDDFDEDDFIDAIEQITGPIIEFNDVKFQSPRRDWDESDFEDFLDTLDDSALEQNGFTPTAGTKEVTMKMVRKDGVFIGAGDGQYIIQIGTGYITDPNGQPFVWDVKTLSGANGS